jgi:putative transposase
VGGYHEIQKPPERYAVIDLQGLTTLCGFTELGDFQRAHRQWVEEALEGEPAARDNRWSEAIAVGSLAFVEKVKGELGVKALHREFEQLGGAYALRERSDGYGGEFTLENDVLRLENTIFCDENSETAKPWRGPTL